MVLASNVEPTTRHYFFRRGQRSNQCVNCSRCGSGDVLFFFSPAPPSPPPPHRLTDAFRRRRRRKSDYEREVYNKNREAVARSVFHKFRSWETGDESGRFHAIIDR